ncbi:uncharacterized protein B0T15DRAFT_556643 [Chaetomium strumarium]|uniref:Uncharacterized protein n=1 Tax=Chaetomium strumarium TaxID=1170767 RepID=A0AAJ0GUC8_9PEZI|nr:hypothetical protein B0T15DRAFT_556643 [Chaetomium strumarium]
MAPAASLLVACLAAAAYLPSAASLPPTDNESTNFGPSEAAARQNAFSIFNAIHSAMRQWGSSLHHNGMSLFLATVPAGVALYHGDSAPDPPPGPEWLAFEIEHAELFAHPRYERPPPPRHRTPPPPGARQHPLRLVHIEESQSPDPQPGHGYGYLHLYRTTAPLHLLYLDGTSAGKTATMGTLDTQDLLLRLNRSAPAEDDAGRARALCDDVVVPWGLHGLVRMEAGFEIIKCAGFLDGLEMISAQRRPVHRVLGQGEDNNNKGDRTRVERFEFIRAVAQRYRGIGAGRVVVDWSSMVSGLFYEVDLGEVDDDMPRLVGLTDEELRGIRGRVEEVVGARKGREGKAVVDWQGVVDLVVGRYADRIRDMAEAVGSLEEMQGEVDSLLNTYIDYAVEDEGYRESARRCAKHYTWSAVPGTQEDKLILTAIETVMLDICSTLFEVRRVVVEDPAEHRDALRQAREAVQGLMGRLRWTRWKECVGCGHNEVCFVPMWPFGDAPSHERPNCRNASTLEDGWRDNSYWHAF